MSISPKEHHDSDKEYGNHDTLVATKPEPAHLVTHVIHFCHDDDHNVMVNLLDQAAPFLFPCTIEYRLVKSLFEPGFT